jgi:hypothetical protein
MVPGIDATGIDKSDPLTKQGAAYASSEAPMQGDDTDESITEGANVSHVDERRLIELQQQAVNQSTVYLSSIKHCLGPLVPRLPQRALPRLEVSV